MNDSNRRTALVTGASSGIGATYAWRLAKDGYDLILVARRKKRLEDLSLELEEKHNISAEVLPADLSKDEGVERVEERMRSCESLHFLVNNAGLSSAEYFINSDIKRQVDIVRVHDIASMRLVHAAVPVMTARGEGVIVNVASVEGLVVGPSQAAYAGSKAFLVMFTEVLNQELHGKGIKVQVVCPGFTRTEIFESSGVENLHVPAHLWMESEEVVEASLKALENGKIVVVPGYNNRLLTIINALPRRQRYVIVNFVRNRIARKMYPDRYV